MRKIKKLAALLLALTLAVLCVSCGGAKEDTSSAASAVASNTSTQSSNLTTVKVGASPSPHAEILKSLVEPLKAQGIDLQIVEFTDYVLPNMSLEAKEIDANYFQHLPYLTDFNQKRGTHLASAVAVHFEPLNIYPGKTASLADIKDGAEIAVPNDTTNEARALQLLAEQGFIKLKDGVGLEATIRDIVENPKKLKFVELPAEQIPRALSDVDFGVINGNYALSAGLQDKALVGEKIESQAGKEFANILAIRAGDENREEIKALVKALTSSETKAFIEQKYGKTVVAVF